MNSLKSLILLMRRSLFLLMLVNFVLGCVTTTPETVKTMSDQFLCEMLGPMWITTSEEQRVIGDELNRRGVVCDYGRIVGYRKEPRKEPSEEIKPPEEHRTSTGTGFAVGSTGTLVTAYHIVEGATNIEVKFSGTAWMPAVLLRYSRSTDVAILKIAKSLSTCLPLRSTNTLKPGDSVFTMGFPVVELLGTEAKYTDGKISSLSGIKGEDSLMQITVPVQPGNSGGPLVTSDGFVVGLITSTAAVKYFFAVTETLPQNINWAVKTDYILPMLREADLKGSKTRIENPVEEVSKAICLVRAK